MNWKTPYLLMDNDSWIVLWAVQKQTWNETVNQKLQNLITSEYTFVKSVHVCYAL